MAGYAGLVSLLAHPMVVYTRSGIGLAYTVAVYTRSISLLVYPMCVCKIYIHARGPNGCAPKIYFTVKVSNCCVLKLLAYKTILFPIKAPSSIFPMVVHPRFISLFVYPTVVWIRMK